MHSEGGAWSATTGTTGAAQKVLQHKPSHLPCRLLCFPRQAMPLYGRAAGALCTATHRLHRKILTFSGTTCSSAPGPFGTGPVLGCHGWSLALRRFSCMES